MVSLHRLISWLKLNIQTCHFPTTREFMSIKGKGKISDTEVFRVIHTRKDGQIIDDHSRDLLERYEQVEQRLRVMRQTQRESTGSIEDDESKSALKCQAWIESVGGPYKSRILGFCPRVHARDACPGTPSHVLQASQEEVHELRRRLEEVTRKRDRCQRVIEDLLLSIGQKFCGSDFQLPPSDDDDDDAPSDVASAPAFAPTQLVGLR